MQKKLLIITLIPSLIFCLVLGIGLGTRFIDPTNSVFWDESDYETADVTNPPEMNPPETNPLEESEPLETGENDGNDYETPIG